MHGSAQTPVVIGNLMLGRCFTLADIPFIGVTSRGDKRICYTRKCIAGYTMPNPEQDMEEAFQWCKTLTDEIGTGHPLFCSNDAHLKLMLTHWDEMNALFRFVSVDKELLETILNKERFIDFAIEHEFPIPQTYTSDNLTRAFNISFPVIVKPIIRLHWFESEAVRKYGGKKHKGILVHSEAELEDVVHLLEKEGIRFVVQQYIPGEESQIFSFHSFFTEDSQPLGYFVGQKIRTYPVEYGQSCALRLTDYPGIVEMSLNLLKRIRYKGPIKIDYKLDPRSGKLYLLELNPTRYNMWHYLGARGGVNLPALAYQYMMGKPVTAPLTTWRKDIVWFNVFDDLRAFWDLKKAGKITIREWLSSYRGKRIYKTWAADDVKPAWYGFRMTMKGLLRRLKRLVVKS